MNHIMLLSLNGILVMDLFRTMLNPVHIFTGTGTFEVILTVYSGSGLSDKASITIEVNDTYTS